MTTSCAAEPIAFGSSALLPQFLEEHGLAKEYGLRRMKEIWKMQAIVRGWRDQAKAIIGLPAEKKEKEEKILPKQKGLQPLF